jgi:hypothetical protein
MPSSGKWCHVDLVWTDVSEERSSETLVHTRSTRHHIPEDEILQSHHSENLKSYILSLSFHRFYKDITLFVIICSDKSTVHMQQPHILQSVSLVKPVTHFDTHIFLMSRQQKQHVFSSEVLIAANWFWFCIPANHNLSVRLKTCALISFYCT